MFPIQLIEFESPPIDGFGYIFSEERPAYFPTLRPWFKSTVEDAGFTTFVSSYMFPEGNLGSTLAQPFYCQNELVGVLGYDILPFSDSSNDHTLIETFLSDLINVNEIEYFTVEQRLLKMELKDQLALDIVYKIYKNDNDTEATLESKAQQISSTMNYARFSSDGSNTISTIKYRFQDDWKYLVIGEIWVLRTRQDGSQRKELANMLGYTVSSKTFEAGLQREKDKVMRNLLGVNILVISVCFLLSLMLSIFASRYIADNIYNKIIDFCIKMRMAQIERKKLDKLSKKLKKIQFSQIRGKFMTSRGLDEWNMLFKKVENFLVIYKIKQFTLHESNSKEYTLSALREFHYVSKIYEDMVDILRDEKPWNKDLELTVNQYQSKLFKCYNAIGGIYYSLGENDKAHKYFSMILQNSEFKQAWDIKSNLSAAYLNGASNLVKMVEKLTNMKQKPSDKKKDKIRDLGSSAYMKLKHSIQVQSEIGFNTEIECLARVLLIHVTLITKRYDDGETELKTLKGVIKVMQRYKDDSLLTDILDQNRLYYKACFMIDAEMYHNNIGGGHLENDVLRSSSRFYGSRCDSRSTRISEKTLRRTQLASFSVKSSYQKLKRTESHLMILRNILLGFGGFKKVDPIIFRGALSLFNTYTQHGYNMQTLSRNNKILKSVGSGLLLYSDTNTRWNVMVGYNPKFVTRYHKCDILLQNILDCFSRGDKFSLLT